MWPRCGHEAANERPAASRRLDTPAGSFTNDGWRVDAENPALDHRDGARLVRQARLEMVRQLSRPVSARRPCGEAVGVVLVSRAVTAREQAADHGWLDHRIALQARIIDWLTALAKPG
jgi:hypothetical protein